ncbi:sigma-54 dependent transcriptional regulator [Escherichia coli]|uniref:sigma-54-dependent transcriptional regulator n=1 Tax=Escherichia coli TaxID=562 RepID=UPI00181EA7C7|nr:sigma-54 dependent transcriptional regulator [Escherichia coli]EFK2137172.1 sigma-54-dependent Fis family transcriptional regulator [Escherichia coli]MCN2118007.1 sigma-54 dependent transcriptional regulator [Escherichia coli]MDB7109381.1 sigma-54 dependent transcriptional regulator [Escherichia coli]MDB7126975.1 sigma-54 dependent transcriptional regulator [Escherichia coli]MDB7131640.1 sigma-54 dependent transcriptional regulator [Escherichia coli]
MNNKSSEITIVYIEDSDDVRFACEQTLTLAGYRVISCCDAEHSIPLIQSQANIIILTDVRLPGISGLELLSYINEMDSKIPVILITGHGDVEMAVDAMRNGAFDFIEKPSSSDKLLSIIARAVEKRRLVLENQQLLANLQQENGPVLIGRSPQMQQLRKMILNVADTGADVLIYGETGCGKEVVARMLHHWSTRRQGQFVALNCAGLPETLFESEIFGHEAGAFTGAVKKRIGKIEHANGGTLFLDEIEGMPSGMQVKLLRVLQERTIERLGANQLIPVNCRVIAATKEDLLRRSEEHLFRLDLYYRLNVVSLNIPPLRQRREDIPELFYWFASQAAQKYNRPLPDISPMLLAWLQSQSWPGNVRELKHNAERFVLGLLTHHQPVPMTQQEESGLTARIDAFEKKLIEDMLRQTEGQVSLTARLLQLPRKTLYDKLNKHQIQPQVYRPESSS